MLKKPLFILTSILLSIYIVGCNNSKENSKETFKDEEILIKSNYTGEKISVEDNINLPFMAMIENSSASRPQSGLSQADIIYETSAEGGIPRFIALFQSESPNKIGPIRSIRPYFIEIAKEFNLPIAHCGGSKEALDMLSSTNSIYSINEIAQEDYFWRDQSKKAPHNLYTSSEKLRGLIQHKSLLPINWQQTHSFFDFDNDYFQYDNLKVINNLKITINKYYNTSYSYEDGLYTKSMDNKLAIDELTGDPLTFSNIIIQKTNIKLNSDGVHLDINLDGSGDGYLLSQGKLVDIKWTKNLNHKTILKDLDGNEIKLSPGKTIWHIIDTKTKIDF